MVEVVLTASSSLTLKGFPKTRNWWSPMDECPHIKTVAHRNS